MTNPTLRDSLPTFLEWIPKIRESNAFKSDAEFQQKLKTAETMLQSIASGLSVRDTLRAFADDLKSMSDPENDTVAKINGKSHSFMHMRMGALSGFLSATWGVYDNILFLCSLLLGCEKSMYTLPAFLDAKQVKINPTILGGIRQRYGYPVAYSYQIRNGIMHRLSFLSDWQGGFASALISDGYLITANGYQQITEECLQNYKIRDGEAANFNFVGNADQCLLEVLDKLQVYTDSCAVEVLQATLHPLNQAAIPPTNPGV